MAEDEIIKKHTKAVYNTWRNPDKKWLHKLKEIAVEILIIVFAVTISIWFHGWAESRKNHREAKEFYRGLKEDLQADLTEMTNDRNAWQEVLRKISYFRKNEPANKFSDDSLMRFTAIFFTVGQINPRISRFEALKGSGKLDIIEDKKKLYNIIDLYQKIFPNIFRSNEAVNALNTERIAPFLGDAVRVDSTGFFTNFREVLGTSKMKLLLAVFEGDVSNSISNYNTGISKCDELIKELEGDE